MSFILDALKKLEQNKKRGGVPDLSTVHLHEQPSPRKTSVWPYLLLAALLLNAGIFMAWLRPWEEKKDVTTRPDTQQEAIITAEKVHNDDSQDSTSDKIILPDNEGTAKKITDQHEPQEETPSMQIEPEISVQPAPPIEKSDEEVIASMGLNPSPEELKILRTKIKEEQQVTEQMPLESVVIPAEPEIIPSINKDDFIEFGQLPEDIKKELPKITINGHIYSDNRSARIANINGYITREGDKVASGLFLDEITTSGAIFSYKEYRFRMRAF